MEAGFAGGHGARCVTTSSPSPSDPQKWWIATRTTCLYCWNWENEYAENKQLHTVRRLQSGCGQRSFEQFIRWEQRGMIEEDIQQGRPWKTNRVLQLRKQALRFQSCCWNTPYSLKLNTLSLQEVWAHISDSGGGYYNFNKLFLHANNKL